MNAWFDRLVLACARHAIDRVDDGVVELFAGRQRLAAIAGRAKAHAGLCRLDPERERAVLERARRRARLRGLEGESVVPVMQTLIAQAHHRQLAPAASPPAPGGIAMSIPSPSALAARLLRWLPPPRYWRPLLSRIPASVHARVVPRVLERAVSAPEVLRSLEAIEGRRIGIDVRDLGLRWVIELANGRLRVADGDAEATIRGSATDLSLLASRQEDADTLFFQRRLELTGDTELGLLLRNLLDRMPWEAIPLAQRIALQRGSQLLQAAREAHARRH